MRRVCFVWLIWLVVNVVAAAGQADAPMFKTGVERVTVAAVVRDSKGKLVTNLSARDFELIDSGRPRPLIGVWSEPSPASVAVLMDASGSMATKMELARHTAQTLIAGLHPGVDEAALYSFATELKELSPFSIRLERTEGAWNTTKPFGATSLWDVIAQTSQEISARQRRRALVVITDGVDSASRLKPNEVSTIASAVDVPVYILVLSFLDDEQRDSQAIQGPLADLATWTGGDSLLVRDSVSAMSAIRQILAELHHQYVIAFEPGSAPGWHPLALRTRKNGLFVRARSGYMVK